MNIPDVSSVLAFIALGSNLGDRLDHLRFAHAALARLPKSTLLRQSRIFETAPVGPTNQGAYLNAVVELATGLGAQGLLNLLLEIERAHGRQRAERWGPRTLDLDILLYGDAVIETPTLKVPHPEMKNRAFVLVPLAELIPDRILPGLGQTPRELLVDLGIDMEAKDWAETISGVRATDFSRDLSRDLSTDLSHEPRTRLG